MSLTNVSLRLAEAGRTDTQNSRNRKQLVSLRPVAMPQNVPDGNYLAYGAVTDG